MTNIHKRSLKSAWMLAALLLCAGALRAADGPAAGETKVTLRLWGVFSPDRVEDLNKAAEQLTDIKMVSADYEKGEATFTYDGTKILKNAKPDQVQKHIDNALRNASNHTIGTKPPCTVEREKLTRVEIPVGVLDCKACGYGLYNMVANVAGVEYAFALYKEGKVVALIDTEKTNRDALVEIFKKREVKVKQ